MPAIRLVNNPTCSCLCLWWNLCRFESINTNCLWAFVHEYFECLVARLNHFEWALIGSLQWWMLGPTRTNTYLLRANVARGVGVSTLWCCGEVGLVWVKDGKNGVFPEDANSQGSSGLSPNTISAGEVCRSSFVAVRRPNRTHAMAVHQSSFRRVNGLVRMPSVNNENALPSH